MSPLVALVVSPASGRRSDCKKLLSGSSGVEVLNLQAMSGRLLTRAGISDVRVDLPTTLAATKVLSAGTPCNNKRVEHRLNGVRRRQSCRVGRFTGGRHPRPWGYLRGWCGGGVVSVGGVVGFGVFYGCGWGVVVAIFS